MKQEKKRKKKDYVFLFLFEREAELVPERVRRLRVEGERGRDETAQGERRAEEIALKLIRIQLLLQSIFVFNIKHTRQLHRFLLLLYCSQHPDQEVVLNQDFPQDLHQLLSLLSVCLIPLRYLQLSIVYLLANTSIMINQMNVFEEKKYLFVTVIVICLC